MIKLGKIKYKNKLIQIILNDDMTRSFFEIKDNKYYELSIEDIILLKKIFNYKNNILYSDKINRKSLFALAIICTLNSMIISKKNLNLSFLNNTNEIIDMTSSESVETILNNNKNLDEMSKQYIRNFVFMIENDFDLSLFKANLKDLEIIYLDEISFDKLLKNKNKSSSVVAFFEIKEHTIYINKNNEEIKSLNHELFHTINNYYDKSNSVFFSYHSITGKGQALLEGMNAFFTNQYFEDMSYPQERDYVYILEQIVGYDRLKYYFEKGTVDDTISDLKNIYGDEEKANKLIMMIDDNLHNKSLMDDECYQENVEDIMDLFQNYFLNAEEKRFEEILEIASEYNVEDQKIIIKLGLNIFFSNCNYYCFTYDDNQLDIFLEKQTTILSDIYNKLSKYNVINKEEFLDYVSNLKDNYEIYSYSDLKDWINGIQNEKIEEDVQKVYKK